MDGSVNPSTSRLDDSDGTLLRRNEFGSASHDLSITTPHVVDTDYPHASTASIDDTETHPTQHDDNRREEARSLQAPRVCPDQRHR